MLRIAAFAITGGSILNVSVFIVGWLLFVLAQAQNSVKSKTNGLQSLSAWLKLQAVNIATRAFFSAMAYGFIINTIASKAQSLGFPLTATTIAGIGGYSANALLYQFFGLFPALRVEVAELAPPAPVVPDPLAGTKTITSGPPA
jgi:hypothetical protein